MTSSGHSGPTAVRLVLPVRGAPFGSTPRRVMIALVTVHLHFVVEEPLSETEDIKTRLLKSDAVTSLRAEQEVVAAFKRLDWWFVEHGAYYRDKVTGKPREIDVLARRSWAKDGGQNSREASLNVIVEVKSVKGFHLVFAPEPHDYRESSAQCAWIGYSRDRLPGVLSEGGVTSEVISHLTSRFTDLSYPKDTEAVSSLKIQPPPAPVYATAFRETNIGLDKELENSVLWKAMQALSSAVESYRQRQEDMFFDNIRTMLSWAVPEGKDVAAMVERDIARSVKNVTLYHPAVVLEARLWVSRGEELNEVEHVRVLLPDPEKYPVRWFDVVTRRSVGQWIDQVTAHYSSRLQHPEEAVWRQGANDMMAFMNLLNNPNLEIEIKAKNRYSDAPPKRILMKTYRRRKGMKPVPVKDAIPAFERDAENPANSSVGPRLVNRPVKRARSAKNERQSS